MKWLLVYFYFEINTRTTKVLMEVSIVENISLKWLKSKESNSDGFLINYFDFKGVHRLTYSFNRKGQTNVNAVVLSKDECEMSRDVSSAVVWNVLIRQLQRCCFFSSFEIWDIPKIEWKKRSPKYTNYLCHRTSHRFITVRRDQSNVKTTPIKFH